MSDNEVRHLLASLDSQLAAYERGQELWSQFSLRCAVCDGNGVHPEAYDEHGDPKPRLFGGIAYFYSVKCEVCDGTGRLSQYPAESSAPFTQDEPLTGGTAQRGGRYSGGDA